MGDDGRAQAVGTEFVNAFLILGTSVYSPYDYFLSTCYKLTIFFYKNLFEEAICGRHYGYEGVKIWPQALTGCATGGQH